MKPKAKSSRVSAQKRAVNGWVHGTACGQTWSKGTAGIVAVVTASSGLGLLNRLHLPRLGVKPQLRLAVLARHSVLLPVACKQGGGLGERGAVIAQCGARAAGGIAALNIQKSTQSAKSPWIVRMSPKYTVFSVLQLGQGACRSGCGAHRMLEGARSLLAMPAAARLPCVSRSSSCSSVLLHAARQQPKAHLEDQGVLENEVRNAGSQHIDRGQQEAPQHDLRDQWGRHGSHIWPHAAGLQAPTLRCADVQGARRCMQLQHPAASMHPALASC